MLQTSLIFYLQVIDSINEVCQVVSLLPLDVLDEALKRSLGEDQSRVGPVLHLLLRLTFSGH